MKQAGRLLWGGLDRQLVAAVALCGEIIDNHVLGEEDFPEQGMSKDLENIFDRQIKPFDGPQQLRSGL